MIDRAVSGRRTGHFCLHTDELNEIGTVTSHEIKDTEK